MRWRTVGWKEPQGPTRQVGCGCVGTWVESLRLQVGLTGDSYIKGRVRCGSQRACFARYNCGVLASPMLGLLYNCWLLHAYVRSTSLWQVSHAGDLVV
ncbi:hypothetical protein GW17_00035505 [Ensete ventricosum]|nr:hypothetical protein GW17_00035505 [Ensete ventricosum]